MTVEELVNDSDWGYVFRESIGSSNSDAVDVVGSCSPDPSPKREDVAEVLASRDGDNEGPSWLGVFRLKDGRYLYATGWCDYTGWG